MRVLGGTVAVHAFSLALLAGAACLSVPAVAQNPDKWGAHLDLEGKLGTERNLGEGGLFLPLYQTPDTLVFGDLRMRFDDNESHEANVGAGVRHMLSSGWNIGGYGYFDRRESPYDNFFNQITVGAEALGRDVDLRVNGYWALGDRSRAVDSLSAAEVSGTSITLRGGEERSMSGFDAEVGWRIPVFDSEADKQLRFYVGGYRFTADDVESIQGPRARVDYTMNELPFLWEGSRLSLGAEWQHDDPRGSQAFAGIRLRIPLQREAGAPHLTAQERRMTDTVIRDIDVVTQAGAFGAAEAVTQTASGQAITVLNSAGTTGAQMITAVAAAGANSTVVLAGSFATTAATQLQAGQTLTGGGIAVRSASGKIARLSSTGATISATGASTNGAVNAADNSTITGLTINATSSAGLGTHAVRIVNVSNVTVSNNVITASETGSNSTNGIVVSGTSSATLTGNRITVVGNGLPTAVAAINVLATGGTTIANNTLSASGATVNNRVVGLGAGAVINSVDSTGNVIVTGGCSNAGATGFVSFTNGTTCP